MATFRFTDGSSVELELGPDVSVLGKDAEGYVVVQWAPAGMAEPMTYALTKCCNATGKGLMDEETGEGFVGCRACYREVDPYLGGPADPVIHPIQSNAPTTRRRSVMSNTRKSQPAAEQFAAMGIREADYTPAMKLAVKQKWSNLPVDAKVDDLRAQLEASKVAPTPVADVLRAQGFDGDADVEAARLKRNAKVNEWRHRNQIQAALDARALKFAAIRAKKSPPVAGAA